MPYFPPLRGTLDNTLSGLTVREPTPEELASVTQPLGPGQPSLQDVLTGRGLANPYDPRTGVLAGSQATTDMFKQQQADQNEEPLTIKSETDVRSGQTKFTADNISGPAMQQILMALKFTSGAASGMQQRINQLAEQEQRTRQNPLLNVLSTVAGNLAVSDPRLPPVVSALGRSSLQLNPTPDQLANERMQLLEQQGRTATLGGGLARALVGDINAERRLDETAKRDQQKANSEMFRSLGRDAQMGLLSDPGIVSRSLQSVGLDPKYADSQAAQLVAVSQARQGLDAQLQATKDAKERERLIEQRREADQRMDMMLRTTEIRTKAMLDATQMKIDAQQGKAAQDKLKVPPAIPQKLADLSAAEKALDEVEAGIRKYSAYQGPVAGRIIEPIGAYAKRDVAKFFDKMQLQVAQAIKSTGAGARGFGPMERGFFERLAESKNHSPTQNLGIIDAWRDYIRQNRSAYSDAYEGLRDEQYRRLYGKDADTILGQGGGAAPAAPAANRPPLGSFEK